VVLKIDIKNAKDKILNKYFFESPDMILIPISKDDIENNKTNSIENIVKSNPITNDTPETVIIYGFEVPDKIIPNVNITNFPIKNLIGTFADKAHKDPFYPANDSLNNVVVPTSHGGMSGSPVFFKYSKIENGEKKEWITFGGVEFGSDSVYNCTFIVKPNIAYREMKNPSIYK
jgi:hypothetical protein